ncbi:ADP-ribosylation factor-like 6 interacting protein 1 [Lycorma delicatula]|uniref:ADP-ribosylation factor-like 6 interacting protein 1 n=1 Tax=Lycorma delicatula TaxID=130591 RepID=UPI003F50E5EA
MNDPATLNTANTIQERRVKDLKRQVEGWREVIVLLQSLLIWEQNWYPGLIFGTTTFVFLLFWFMDPSLLTAVSVICLILTLLDNAVPTICATFCNASNWTGNKERQLEEFCRTVIDYKLWVQFYWTNLQNMKTSQPRLYYTVVTASLVFLAWLGNCNNMVLTYVFVTSLLLLPGLIYHGYLQKYYGAVLLGLASLLRNLTGDKVKIK